MTGQFNNTKIGDKVIIQSTVYGHRDTLGVVEKKTDARLYVRPQGTDNYVQFWRKNGERVGSRGALHSSWIIPYDEKHFKKIEEQNFRDDFAREMRNRKWHNCPTSTMKLVLELIKSGEQANG